MREIKFSTPAGDLELQVEAKLIEKIAQRNGIPDNQVTDDMVIRFFQEASNVAFHKATAGYVSFNGKDS
jgi:hypothetical protein